VPPDTPDLLLAELQRLATLTPGELADRGARGRAYALRHVTEMSSLPTLIRLIEEAAGTPDGICS
jgi:hypothetical protein